MSSKDTTTVMRLDIDTIKKIKEMAKLEDRTMKSFVKRLIDDKYKHNKQE